MFNEIIKKTVWNSHTLTLSTGKIARQADSAVVVSMGDTVILCTVVSAKKPKDDTINFLPLTVNYREMAFAAGKIPGGFVKREGKATERESLVSRLIDRPIRPLVNPSFFCETQVLCTVLSYDPKHNPDILSIIGASAALAISGAPYEDIVAASRVGFIDNQFVINPSIDEIKNSKLDLVIAGTKTSVMMVESEAQFLTEEQMLSAVKLGHEAFQPVIDLIKELEKEVNKEKIVVSELFPESLKNKIIKLKNDDIINAFKIQEKQKRYQAFDKIKEELLSDILNEEGNVFNEVQILTALQQVESDILRKDVLDNGIRIDGRKSTQIRPIDCQVSILPRTHGSALFTRGETQSLVVSTLGTSQDEQIVDDLHNEYKERFMLNYIFPPYSVGEAGSIRAPGRREIGHGKLAWRAILASLPSKEDFPYSIRVVSEITESNGSSSMATVCGTSMSLMDAGVPIKCAISGIAMGLIKDKDRFIILSDILGDEDHLGDMDFKVAGSSDGITALQMDIKVSGIDFEIMKQALDQAKEGRRHILNQMNKAIVESKSQISVHAPTIKSIKIDKDKIRDIIGPGGKVIREICDTTSTKIDIDDDGNVSISGLNGQFVDEAVKKILDIVFVPKVGDIFDANVVKILDSGVFVSYLGNRESFVHISEISNKRIKFIKDVLADGQSVKVKIIGFDNKGRIRMSIKSASTNDEITTDDNIASDIEHDEPKDKRIKFKDSKNVDNTNDDTPVLTTERKYFN